MFSANTASFLVSPNELSTSSELIRPAPCLISPSLAFAAPSVRIHHTATGNGSRARLAMDDAKHTDRAFLAQLLFRIKIEIKHLQCSSLVETSVASGNCAFWRATDNAMECSLSIVSGREIWGLLIIRHSINGHVNQPKYEEGSVCLSGWDG
ncbi:hypothetical protein JTE90_029648 [Oedothorax gibbosus]|uniref:Uncharacterized protein n=1 Tax=Oedothorax gibbosus TaxID=931172 RepID=A0AAV6VGD3_9ARAC|nr:hypothetical protein JTE90_029648 [Oedothorax gibbosus]